MAEHAMDVLEMAECVAVYISYGQEPPTGLLIQALRSAQIQTIAPRIAGDELTWTVIDSDTEWVTSALGIDEPLGASMSCIPDAVIIPALAVDLAGHRLGQGKGYYDRYLATLPDSTLRIAYVYDDDVILDVPVEPHDVPVNIIVTDARLIATA